MVHASFPGGRSGALREESGGSKAPSTKGSEFQFPNVEWDVRFVAGLGADPDAHAFNPEYFEMEGLKGDEARRAHRACEAKLRATTGELTAEIDRFQSRSRVQALEPDDPW